MEYFDNRGGANRYKIKDDFFQIWSNEMAYVLGFLYADGTIIDAKSSRTQYIAFSSKDKNILDSVKFLLQSKHPIYIRPPQKTLHRNGKIYESSKSFCLRIGNRKMFADLKKIGLTPNKSKTIKFPTNIPNKYLSHFIRGYFDGDGCIYLQRSKGKTQKLIIKKLSIIFTSGSKIFLEGLNSSLRKNIELNQNKVYNSHWSYELRYSTSDTIKLFKFLYKDLSKNTYLKRKLRIFLKYFQLRNSKIDKNIGKILKNLRNGLVPEKLRERSAKPFYVGASPAQAS